jgi:thioredoxin reductase (NADPH)
MKVEDVIIIGGGPSGISCAVQLARCGIKPIIFERENLGGLLVNANLVENYPGFPKGISGIELTKLLKEQVKKQKIKVIFEEVISVISEGEIFKVTAKETSLYSKFVVVASGTRPKKFKDCPIPNELKSKVFYEVYPLRSERNKKIVIVGAGDAAFDYALNLKKHNKVLILNRKEKAKCIPLLFERVRKSDNISYKKNIKIKKIVPSSSRSFELECRTPEKRIVFKADYLLFAIGREPYISFLSQGIKNKRIYLAGDVKNGIFRQTAVAIGDGIKTAMKIYGKIEKGK